MKRLTKRKLAILLLIGLLIAFYIIFIAPHYGISIAQIKDIALMLFLSALTLIAGIIFISLL